MVSSVMVAVRGSLSHTSTSGHAISVAIMSEKTICSPSSSQLPPMWLQPSLPVTVPSALSSRCVSSAPDQVPSGELDASSLQPAASMASRHVVSRADSLRTVGMWWSLLLGEAPAPGERHSIMTQNRPASRGYVRPGVCSLATQVAAEPAVSLCARGVHPGDRGRLALIGVFGAYRIEGGHRGGVPDVRFAHVDHHILRVAGVVELVHQIIA